METVRAGSVGIVLGDCRLIRLVILGIGILFLVFGILGLGAIVCQYQFTRTSRVIAAKALQPLLRPRERPAIPRSNDRISLNTPSRKVASVVPRRLLVSIAIMAPIATGSGAGNTMQFLVYAIITSSLCFEYLGDQGYAPSSIAYAQELLAVVAVLVVVVGGVQQRFGKRGRRLLACFRRARGDGRVRPADEWR